MISLIKKYIVAACLVFLSNNQSFCVQETSSWVSIPKMQGCPFCHPPKNRCPHCPNDTTLFSPKELKKHLICNHTTKKARGIYSCNLCGGKNIKSIGIHVQKNDHCDKNFFTCPVTDCKNKKISREYTFLNHISLHPDDRAPLVKHIKEYHIKPGIYACAHCTKTFASKIIFLHHMICEHNINLSRNSVATLTKKNKKPQKPKNAKISKSVPQPLTPQQDLQSKECFFNEESLLELLSHSNQ